MTFLLQVDNLTKKYGDNNVVDAVSFELEEHTATALIGPNGAGKTTTLSMLAGLVTPTERNDTVSRGLQNRISGRLLGFFHNIRSSFLGYLHLNLLKWLRG